MPYVPVPKDLTKVKTKVWCGIKKVDSLFSRIS
mgnify:CR=1 FL=1